MTVSSVDPSPQQRRIAHLMQAYPGVSFGARASLTIGDVSQSQIEAALQAVAREHEILRTTVVVGADGPMQQIVDEPRIAWDEEGGPGVIGARLDAGTLHLSVGPGVLDRASWTALGRLLEAYSSSAAVAEPLQYADIAVYLSERQAEHDALGTPAPSMPRTDLLGARRGVPSGPGYTCSVPVSDETLRSLEQQAQQRGSSLGAALEAAWAALIWRSLDAPGSAVSVARLDDGRELAELSETLGCFSRFVPAAWTLDEHTSWDDLMTDPERRERDPAGTWGAVDAAVPAFGFEASVTHEACREIEVVDEPIDVRLAVRRSGQRLPALTVHTLGARYGAEDAMRLAERLATLVVAIVTQPERPLLELALLGRNERAAIDRWSQPARAAVTAPSNLVTAFAEQVARTPDRIAIGDAQTQLTYRQLHRQSDRLAHQLRVKGVCRGARVGLLVERTASALVAILGILKAGAAYVPVEPTAPEDRRAYTFQDAGVKVVLDDEALAAALAEAPADVEPLPLELGRDDLAYVIYTSGSTGRPKGVAVSHFNVTRLVAALGEDLEFSAQDVWSLCHSLAFDVSVYEIWGALMTGARIVMVPRALTQQPAALWTRLIEEKVTVLSQTPSAFAALSPAQPQQPHTLQKVLFAGEALPFAMLQEWVTRNGDEAPELVNLYGITETTVHVTVRRVTASDVAHACGSMIGRPMADLSIRIVDADLRPVPMGTTGEIVVGGPGVAHGYLGRQDLTAERFVTDPDAPGIRLYRSGDLGRLLPNGDIEHRGRNDHQVKIRGFRIELGEVEAACADHPDVAAAAVLVDRRADNDERLVAFVQTGSKQLAPAALRDHVRKRLPEYMVPSSFVPVEAFPLTRNGKVDRRALAEVPVCGPEPTGDGSTPTTPAETLVAAVFAEIMGLPAVGIDDSLFDLGGHSLLVTQIAARLEESTGFAIPLPAIFAWPTARALGRVIEAIFAAGLRGESTAALPAGWDGTDPTQWPDVSEEIAAALRDRLVGAASATSPIPTLGHTSAPLTHAQARMLFAEELDPGTPQFNVSAAFRVTGPLELDRVESVFATIVQRHAALRTRVADDDGIPCQVVEPDVCFTLGRFDLATHGPALQATITAFIRERADLPLSLEHAPLLRVDAARVSSDAHVLLVTMHHIVTDDRSLGIVLEDFVSLYRGDGRPTPVLQFPDYAHWEQHPDRAPGFEPALAYWDDALAAAPDPGVVPGTRPDAVSTQTEGHSVPVEIEPAAYRALAALVPETTPFAALLAVYALLHRVGGASDQVVIGIPVANRRRPETHDVIGLFVNSLALRIDMSGDPSMRSIIARASAAVVAGLTHEAVPFDLVHRNAKRGGRRSPLFRTWLALQNTPQTGFALDGHVTVEPLPLSSSRVPFELAMLLWPTAAGGLTGYLEGRRDLIDTDALLDQVETLHRLLCAACERPDAPLSSLIATPTAVREAPRAVV